MLIEILFWGVQAFFILQSGVQFFLPYHWRWYYVILDNLSSCFMIHMLLRMRYFKSINLFIGVILGYISPKVFSKDCCYCGACKWPKFFIYPPGEISFLSPCSYQFNLVSIYGRFSPQVLEMFSISPQQACSFRCWFPNNSVKSFFLRVLSQIHLR